MSQNSSQHIYEAIVRATPERIWQALTTPEQTQKYYFGCRVESDWQEGSPCRYYGAQGAVNLDGKIVEIVPGQRLVTTFEPKWVPSNGAPSKLSWEIQPMRGTSLIRLTHSDIDDATFEAGRMHMGWVFTISALKTLLETGEGLPSMFA